jgi:hypothetical protein
MLRIAKDILTTKITKGSDILLINFVFFVVIVDFSSLVAALPHCVLCG